MSSGQSSWPVLNLPGKCFLTYPGVMSMPETTLAIAKVYKLSEIVGQATGDNNGA